MAIRLCHVHLIQNQNFSTNQSIQADIIKMGFDVNPTKPSGNVNFNEGSFLIEGNYIQLTPGVRIESGVEFKANALPK